VFRLDGNRQKKRVRQPHSTADRHRKKALNDGEYIMEDGGGGRANYSVHFNLPDAGEYGENILLSRIFWDFHYLPLRSVLGLERLFLAFCFRIYCRTRTGSDKSVK
jgi:hypothetical protein